MEAHGTLWNFSPLQKTRRAHFSLFSLPIFLLGIAHILFFTV
jgi:hypothetical protein